MKSGWTVLLILLAWSQVHAAVLVEDNGRPTNQTYIKTAGDGFSLRSIRKMGVGVGMGGAQGLLGLNMELNFTPRTSLNAGFGLGSGFQTFHLAIKSYIPGRWFLPYMTAGFARWYSAGDPGNLDETSPGFLGERFLDSSEKRAGEFSEFMIYPGLGIQYLQLKGEWAGISLYGEIVMMIDIDGFVAAPTGGLGMNYYF